MRAQQFDLLSKSVAASASRRRLLALMAGTALAWRPGRSAAQGEPACASGLTACPGAAACVDLQTDLNHCGACGAICASELVPVECRAGECVRASCPEGVAYCGAVDGCRDLAADPSHCGACGNACASGVCDEGVCSVDGAACAGGEVACDGVCVATCCNNEHCGACGNACAPPLTCFEGICDCPSGNCPPVRLPDTGVGATGEARAAPWALLAALAAAAKAIAERRPGRTVAEAEPDPMANG